MADTDRQNDGTLSNGARALNVLGDMVINSHEVVAAGILNLAGAVADKLGFDGLAKDAHKAADMVNEASAELQKNLDKNVEAGIEHTAATLRDAIITVSEKMDIERTPEMDRLYQDREMADAIKQMKGANVSGPSGDVSIGDIQQSSTPSVGQQEKGGAQR